MSQDEVTDILGQGVLELEGRLVLASNASFVGTVSLDGRSVDCVYKPVRGERPLWDFPDGTLAAREVAAYAVSTTSGWNVVPPTVLRDGPFGPGMCQQWIDTDPERELVDLVPTGAVEPGWLRVLDAEDGQGKPVSLVHADDAELLQMAVFDVIVNNADRKGGHVLASTSGPVLGVDHGVTFHVDNKLRTLLWGWAGQQIPTELVEDLRRLAELAATGPLAAELRDLLSVAEHRALLARIKNSLRRRTLPLPSRSWPSIPWPPF